MFPFLEHSTNPTLDTIQLSFTSVIQLCNVLGIPMSEITAENHQFKIDKAICEQYKDKIGKYKLGNTYLFEGSLYKVSDIKFGIVCFKSNTHRDGIVYYNVCNLYQNFIGTHEYARPIKSDNELQPMSDAQYKVLIDRNILGNRLLSTRLHEFGKRLPNVKYIFKGNKITIGTFDSKTNKTDVYNENEFINKDISVLVFGSNINSKEYKHRLIFYCGNSDKKKENLSIIDTKGKIVKVIDSSLTKTEKEFILNNIENSVLIHNEQITGRNFNTKFKSSKITLDLYSFKAEDRLVKVGETMHYINTTTLGFGNEVLTTKLATNVNIKSYIYFGDEKKALAKLKKLKAVK